MSATLEQVLDRVNQVAQTLENLSAEIVIGPQQVTVVHGLSDIDSSLGIVEAGEFRAGNGVIPGDGFSGVRIRYPGMTYNSQTWHIAGVENDVLQFGVRATDGVALAGGGAVVIDEDGIQIVGVDLAGIGGTVNGAALNFLSTASGPLLGQIYETGTGTQYITQGLMVVQDVTGSGKTGIEITARNDSNSAIWAMESLTPSIAGLINLTTILQIKSTGLHQTQNGSGGGYYGGASSDVQWYRGAADLWRTPDSVTIDTGLNLGTASGAGAGDLAYSGDLEATRNSVAYTGYIYVPLATRITSSTLNGAARSTTAKTLHDNSVEFAGVPGGIKAIHVQVVVRDSGSAANDTRLILWHNNTANLGIDLDCAGLANDAWERTTAIVPCDANGDIYWQIVASGASTFDCFLFCLGYWL